MRLRLRRDRSFRCLKALHFSEKLHRDDSFVDTTHRQPCKIYTPENASTRIQLIPAWTNPRKPHLWIINPKMRS